MKLDDLYARAWESENETPVFDNARHEPDNYNSPDITVTRDLKIDQTCTIPENIQMK